MRAAVLCLATLALAPALQACPSCPYETQCSGDVLMFCTLGVDQLVGSPERGERTCEAPNPSCVTVDDRTALCATSPDRTCTVGIAPRCDGQVLVTCEAGFEVAKDCAADGNVCGELDGAGRCYADPLTACESDDTPTCEGDVLIRCEGGYLTREDCGLRSGNPTCQTVDEPDRKYAYCG
ncbi:MAG: hypothetical protein KC933_12525 [Myxococcales bacterium]|nr:hypothetical protein [Myxococcales bacterium]